MLTRSEGSTHQGDASRPIQDPSIRSADLHRWPQTEEFGMNLLDSSPMDPKPVFVDGPRWRRPTLRWLGVIIAGVLAVYLWVVGLALLSTVKVPPTKLPPTVSTSSSGDDEPRVRPSPRRSIPR